MIKYSLILAIVGTATIVFAADWHVSKSGDDKASGTLAQPLLTIQQAAMRAQPGDTVTVHAGIYRERVDPPRGGESDAKRILYQAAPGEQVEIRGSEVVTGWNKVDGDVWKIVIPNSFFGDFNPFNDIIRGDWFRDNKRQHHTGTVYLNGKWLLEAKEITEVFQPAGIKGLWFSKVDDVNTTIHAQFKGANPNDELTEVNVGQTVFYPTKTGCNFITVRGFKMCHAATPWAPPTVEQIGLIGVNWSKGWIIENNDISYSTCVGITLGKYGDEWENTRVADSNGYVATIKRALEKGWSPATIGHHSVRNNHISHCKQAGLVGSMGAVFSVIEGNEIHDIHMDCAFSGDEQAGIKLHGAIDTVIRNNHIYKVRGVAGIWLDWMTQGTRVSGNLLHENGSYGDVFLEVNHGPILLDDNILLSKTSISDQSQGTAYVHNLIAGKITTKVDTSRYTPWFKPHSLEGLILANIVIKDSRFFNNLLVDPGQMDDYKNWNNLNSVANASIESSKVTLEQRADGWWLKIMSNEIQASADCAIVTTGQLGKALVPDQPFEQPDGAPYVLDTDYFNVKRPSAPMPGPIEGSRTRDTFVKVWPKNKN
ncbi:MAG: right-handed parallel beta-helix repeat-containing protein [Verrucomicrobia bacterium]|nr:right-handed parallel beta-helix repeat-containing protein [Verrucomicrobiota bacterium]